jgi:hypothetical protein
MLAGRHLSVLSCSHFNARTGFMNKQRKLFLCASLVVMGGGAYLSTPAEMGAQTGTCSESEWQSAASRARSACGGPASFAGYCAGGTFYIETIYCVQAT